MDQASILAEFRSSMSVRPASRDEAFREIMVGLLSQYFDRVEDAARVFSLMKERDEFVLNDHIAFRSLDCFSLLKIFLHYDYKVMYKDVARRIPFNFAEKKLTAVWLSHPNPSFPRVFISQCRLDELPEIKSILLPYIEQKCDPIDSLDLDDPSTVVRYLHTRIYPPVTYQDYCVIKEASEYVAWVLFNRYYLNHFTLTVSSLKSFGFQETLGQCVALYQKKGLRESMNVAYLETLKACYKLFLEQFNEFLRESGFKLNSVDGCDLNISEDGLLLQSSTKAALIEATFVDGTYRIPGSYVEFAYRGMLESKAMQVLNGELALAELEPRDFRDGFETANANNIFESTYTKKPISEKKGDQVEALSTFKKDSLRLHAFLDQYQTGLHSY